MINIGIAGIRFIGMKRRRILGTVRKPNDFRKILATLSDSLGA
jgi:hypothetical protein